MLSGAGHVYSKETYIVRYVWNVFVLHRPLKGWLNFSSVAWKSKRSKPTRFIMSMRLVKSLSYKSTEKQESN